MKKPFNAIKITDKVYWVGAVDWEIRSFHGYSTNRGTTYNAFLIMADKVTLIDTVKYPFRDELLSRISSVITPEKIDYVISNHSEMDHTGSLPFIINAIKPEKVFASVAGVKALNSHFGTGDKITPVKTGDKINIGNMNISFIETKMLHWPDSMFSYLHEEQILFSQDAFGMHLATSKIFDDEVGDDILESEAKKYLANILMPFSELILKCLKDLRALNLPLKMIAPDHGVIWRSASGISRILSSYEKWSLKKPLPKALVVYDTMWNSTAEMAKSIAEGIISTGVEVRVLPASSSHRSDAATEILEAGILAAGSPTLNNSLLPPMADILTYIKGLRPKNMLGAAFGSFGWSGESVNLINDYLKSAGIELLGEGIKVKYVPTEKDLADCYELGRNLGLKLLDKIKQGDKNG